MTTTLQELKPSQIKPHKNNPRHDVGDVTDLAASILAQGVLEPLLVAPNGTGTSFVLLAGHRRLAAAKAAKCKTVPCIVRDDLTDPQRQLETMLVENLQRSDLSPVEEAEAYQQLLAFPGYTQKRITETTGRTAATVRARLKIAKLPRSALQKIHEHQISLMEAEGLAEFADDKSAYGQLERAAGDPQHFARIHRDLRAKRTRARKVEKLTKELEDAGVRIVEAPGYGYGRSSKLTPLQGDTAVEQHRSCEGFCAYIRSDSWSAGVEVVYACDKPELHRAEEEEEDSEVSARNRVYEERRAKQKEAAETRRSHLAGLIAEPKDGDGWAIDLLRQHVHEAVKHCDAFAASLLGVAENKKAIAARIDDLSWQQLAVLLDVVDHRSAENAMEGDWGWEAGGSDYSGARKWRTRLESVYGYEWSPAEREFLDQAAAAAATPDGDDAGDEDADDDDLVDDNAEWADEE